MFEHFGRWGQSGELLLDELAKKSRTKGGPKNGAVLDGLETTFVYPLTEMQQSGDPEKDCLTLPETA